MRINYLEDLHVPGLGEWSPTSAGDWLHPLHGPLPDHLGLLECEEREFMAALWETPNALVVMLEQLETEGTDPRVPMRRIDDVYSMRGWIIQTYLWVITAGEIIHGSHKIIPDEYRDDHAWREEIYRTAIAESVKICVSFPEGLHGS